MIEANLRLWMMEQLGTRVFYSAVPQSIKDPAVIAITATSKDRAYAQTQTSTVCQTTFNITQLVHTNNEISGYEQVKTLTEQVRTTLEAYPDTMGDSTIYCVMVKNESDNIVQYLDNNEGLVIGVTLSVEIAHSQ